jgi:hypothetical protein
MMDLGGGVWAKNGERRRPRLPVKSLDRSNCRQDYPAEAVACLWSTELRLLHGLGMMGQLSAARDDTLASFASFVETSVSFSCIMVRLNKLQVCKQLRTCVYFQHSIPPREMHKHERRLAPPLLVMASFNGITIKVHSHIPKALDHCSSMNMFALFMSFRALHGSSVAKSSLQVHSAARKRQMGS